jgi:hypothetical protein
LPDDAYEPIRRSPQLVRNTIRACRNHDGGPSASDFRNDRDEISITRNENGNIEQAVERANQHVNCDQGIYALLPDPATPLPPQHTEPEMCIWEHLNLLPVGVELGIPLSFVLGLRIVEHCLRNTDAGFLMSSIGTPRPLFNQACSPNIGDELAWVWKNGVELLADLPQVTAIHERMRRCR